MTDTLAIRNSVEATLAPARQLFERSLPVDQKKNVEHFMRLCADQVMDNEKLLDIARNNPGSLNLALSRVAQVGLSPAKEARQVYLIPRGNEITVNISYLGYSELVMRTGLVERIVSDVVYENDGIEEDGYGYPKVIPGGDPKDLKARFEGRKSRGEPFASFAYLIYKDGSRSELYTADRDRVIRAMEASESWKKDKQKNTNYSPWNKHREEMIRKTAIHVMVKHERFSVEDWRDNAEALKEISHDLTLAGSEMKARAIAGQIEAQDYEADTQTGEIVEGVGLASESQKNEIVARAQKLKYPSQEVLEDDISKWVEGKKLADLTAAEADQVLSYLTVSQ